MLGTELELGTKYSVGSDPENYHGCWAADCSEGGGGRSAYATAPENRRAETYHRVSDYTRSQGLHSLHWRHAGFSRLELECPILFCKRWAAFSQALRPALER